jgi:3-keto-5-aminohexanoate cleavage enzyme
VMHVHYRNPTPGLGHLPSWDPNVAAEVTQAIRDACPGVIINMTTGTMGPDISGPLACLTRIRPEMAACNAGSLNYLKVKSDGKWAWPPMIFDNGVDKVERFLKAMEGTQTVPEFECFDVGIVRCVGLYADAGLTKHPEYNFVMGVESGMPADPELLPILLRLIKPGSNWQVTAIGRQEIWALQRRVAELGGMLRTGVEDTFYLPSGEKATGNGPLVETLVGIAREAGREIASPAEARAIIGIA